MGIRFQCHHCHHGLHVKDIQAGQRGRCPHCRGAFRIPLQNSPLSLPVDKPALPVNATPQVTPKQHATASQPDAERSTSPFATTLYVGPEVSAPPAPEPHAPLPPSLIPHHQAEWLIRPPSGGEYRADSSVRLVEWIAEHRITSDTLLQVMGEDTWQTAKKWVPELFPDTSETQSPAAPPVRTAPVAADALPPHLTDDSIARDATRGSIAAAKAALLQRRRRQQIRTWVILGLLIAIVLALGATLVVLLWR